MLLLYDVVVCYCCMLLLRVVACFVDAGCCCVPMLRVVVACYGVFMLRDVVVYCHCALLLCVHVACCGCMLLMLLLFRYNNMARAVCAVCLCFVMLSASVFHNYVFVV